LAEQALEVAVRMTADESGGLAILALGRLGLEEFDLLSDVDLIFLAPEAGLEAAHRRAARVIEVVTAYMQDGTLFAIDTRLRPGGGEGELVQSPAAVEQYFRERGSAWEAVSYLKARPVAGDCELAAQALANWRPVLAQRFGDASRLRPALREMRQRIEHEPRPGRRGVKTGKGGYYDVDFIVSSRILEHRGVDLDGLGLAEMALRLGEIGLLHPDSAHRLADGVRLLRAADHAIRIVMGKSPLTRPRAVTPPKPRMLYWSAASAAGSKHPSARPCRPRATTFARCMKRR
jgi:glutamate-ammonia-ligase adenylyltransferase